jgi:nucleoid DNA-binding protein
MIFSRRFNHMTITRKELSVRVSSQLGCRKSLAEAAIDSIFHAMQDALLAGERIEIRGFGVFEVRKANARRHARNPRTGETLSIPPRRKVHFKPGKLIKKHMKDEEDPGDQRTEN